MAIEKPIGIALIICDRVITDATTQEKTLVATFNSMQALFFPAVVPRLSVFISVTGGRGVLNAEVRCVNETEQNALVFGMKGTIPFADPNVVVEMAFQFNNPTFPKAGLHAIEFLCEGELILQRRFAVALFRGPAQASS